MAAVINMFEVVTTLRAELAFYVDAIMAFDLTSKLGRNKVQCFLVHRAVLDCIDRSVGCTRPFFEPSLEHRHDRRLASANRPHQQQYALADLQTLAGRLEVLDDPGNGTFDSEQFFTKEVVPYYFVARSLVDLLDAACEDHIANAGVRQFRYIRILSYQFEVVSECAFPGQPLAVAAVSLEEVAQVYFVLSHVSLQVFGYAKLAHGCNTQALCVPLDFHETVPAGGP